MPLTNDFKDAVADGNIRRVRIMMKDSMVRDPLLNEFEEMRREAEAGKLALYDTHDGESFNNNNKADWNKSYMNSQLVSLMSNFSRERISHLKNVIAFVYADEIKKLQAMRPAQQRLNDDRNNNRRDEKRGSNNIFILIMGAALIALIIIFLLIKGL